VKKKDGDAFGPMMNPQDVYKAKRATDLEHYIFIAGVLRNIGIPARIKWSFDAVEYWDNGWQEKSFVQRQEKKNVWVGLKFKQDTIDVTSKVNYYEDFSITKFKENTERLEPSIDTLNGYQIVTLDQQPSYLISGWRNGFGDTYVRLKRILPIVDTAKYFINNNIPEDIKPGDLMIREYHGFPNLNKTGANSKNLEVGNVLIIIFDGYDETIRNARECINNFKGKVLFFDVSGNVYFLPLLQGMGIKNGTCYGGKEIYKNWGIKNLPSILLLKDGKCIFWTEGLNLHLSRLIQTFQN
jgi:hypothetical protein